MMNRLDDLFLGALRSLVDKIGWEANLKDKFCSSLTRVEHWREEFPSQPVRSGARGAAATGDLSPASARPTPIDASQTWTRRWDSCVSIIILAAPFYNNI